MGPASQWLPVPMGPCDSERRRVAGPSFSGISGGGTGAETERKPVEDADRRGGLASGDVAGSGHVQPVNQFGSCPHKNSVLSLKNSTNRFLKKFGTEEIRFYFFV